MLQKVQDMGSQFSVSGFVNRNMEMFNFITQIIKYIYFPEWKGNYYIKTCHNSSLNYI
jgi:hypothetical protein